MNLDFKKYNFLVTGGAGFIGSNLVAFLLKNDAKKVRVLDNLSTGKLSNISRFFNNNHFEFIEGDIRDFEVCRKALDNMNFVFHEAALGSVPRSIDDPITSAQVNITGFINVLTAAKESKDLLKLIYASSSSTYGNSQSKLKIEGEDGKLLSPYAVTKLVNEIYAENFSKVYGLNTIGLRYFNVFGPYQNPHGPYAAVIPIFCKNIIQGLTLDVNGDGSISRDFTFIDNIILANILAIETYYRKGFDSHKIYNVGCGDSHTLNELVENLKVISNKDLSIRYLKERPGDVHFSQASISRISNDLGYSPEVNFYEGIQKTYEWYYNQDQISKEF